MSVLPDFRGDPEFCKLLARQTEIDLTAAALEVARDFDPTLDVTQVKNWVKDRASELAGPLARARSERVGLEEFGRCLSRRHGLMGSKEIYDEADGSFLHRVIFRKTGLPISLAVLYMAVGEQVGWPLQGVSSPGHFLTRYESVDGPWFVDPFAGGEVLSLRDCVQRIQGATGVPLEVALSSMASVGPRVIIIRMLNNLKSLFARQGAWERAATVQQRLLALQPGVYGERRDLALILLKSRRSGLALELLQKCLTQCPDEERPLLQQSLLEAQRGVAICN